MSEEAKKEQKKRKVNRMTKDQAKAVLAKLEASGEKFSVYHGHVKAQAED